MVFFDGFVFAQLQIGIIRGEQGLLDRGGNLQVSGLAAGAVAVQIEAARLMAEHV